MSAIALISWLMTDATPLPAPKLDCDPLSWPGYPEHREEARARTGVDEAVRAVQGRLGDRPAVLVAWDFDFLGGSMSSAVGAIVAGAYDHARERQLPVVLLPSTGGARMQEGMASLAQMAVTTVAARDHAAAGLLQIAVLQDPTTGGVFASHASLADVLLIEPAARVGFAGPRVAKAMTGSPLPPGSHTAEGAFAAGLVDAVVPRPELPSTLASLIAWPGNARTGVPTDQNQWSPDHSMGSNAWAEIERSRAEGRPRTPDFLAAVEIVTELHGDRAGNDDATIRVALTRWDGMPVVVVGMDRTADGGRIGPSGYRKAWRGISLADRLGVPLVTLIDTPGADASAAGEAGGIAAHIARTFGYVLDVNSPVVSLVIGEGGSGGALALAVADRLLIQEHATFSVIAPEAAAAILHRDPNQVSDVAALLNPTALGMYRLGIADEVVPEPPGQEVTVAVAAVSRSLRALSDASADTRLDARKRRWRHAGRNSL